MTSFSRAGQITETFAYNPVHHLLQFHTATVNGGPTLLDRVLEYDANGNMFSLIDHENSGEIVCYQHNNRNFLTAAWSATQANPNCTQAEAQRGQGPGVANFSARWTYDDAGNIVSAGGPGTASPTSTNGNRAAYGYTGTGPHAVTRLWQQDPNGPNPVLWRFDYDANGNQIERTDETAGITHHLGYDARNRLVEIGTTPGADNILDSVYDGNGTRLVRRTGGDSVYYLGNVEIHDQADGTRIERTTYSFEGRTIGSRDVTTTPGTGPSPVVLGYIVTNPNSLMSAETTVLNRLDGLGYNQNSNTLVLIADGDVDNGSGLPNGIDAVLVSPNAIATDVDATLETTSLPVMVLKDFLFDDLGLSANRSTATGQTQIDITANTHPITAGLTTGTTTVLSSSGGIGSGVGPVGDVLGTVVGDTNRGTIIALDQGDPLAGGGTAPGRRVGFFAINALPNKLNTTGWDLFDRSLNWTTAAAQTGGGGTPTVTNELHWVVTDHLGTPTVTTTQTGSTVQESLRYPFGTVRHTAGSAVTDIDFTGQTNDPGTGLIDYNARHYDPLIGRFAAADPLVADGANRYNYVQNRPDVQIDPTGLDACPGGGGGCGGVRGAAVSLTPDFRFYGQVHFEDLNGDGIVCSSGCEDRWMRPRVRVLDRSVLGPSRSETFCEGPCVREPQPGGLWPFGSGPKQFSMCFPFCRVELGSKLRATAVAEDVYGRGPGSNGDDGEFVHERNALQHSLWMAIIAQEKGLQYAVDFGLAHELDRSGGRLNDRQSDLHNNAQGARLGAAYPDATVEELTLALVAEIESPGSRLTCLEPGRMVPCN